jgi:hypothetical protein
VPEDQPHIWSLREEPTVGELLLNTSRRWGLSEYIGHRALHFEDGGVEKHDRMIREQVGHLSLLSYTMSNLKLDGVPVPDEVFRLVSLRTRDAHRALIQWENGDRSTFGIQSVITQPGDGTDGRNLLEQLAVDHNLMPPHGEGYTLLVDHHSQDDV